MKLLGMLHYIVTLILLSAAVARGDLNDDVRAVLREKLLSNVEVGIQIVRLGATGSESVSIYDYKSTAPRVPASNLKLVTTAAALAELGADFQFRTILARRGDDLALIGDGDPTLGDAEMLKKVGWSVDTVFTTWAEMLRKRGITQVRDVIVDDSIFDQQFVHPNWPAEQEHKRYVAQVGGVNLNANCVDFYLRTRGAGELVESRTEPSTEYVVIANTCVAGSSNAVWLSRKRGTNDIVLRGQTIVSNDEPISVTVHDPPMFAATVLAETLRANGVKISGEVKRDRTVRESMSQVTKLAVHSTPLSAVLARANKDSMNLYADALCKRLGAATSGGAGSWANGTAAMDEFLQSIGVSKEEYNLDDGCGLSKKNRISANALAKVLARQFQGSGREVFLKSLAVAGVDGTFEHRFRDSDLRGRVFGKSGYVNGVSSCSGFLKARNEQWYAFAIIMDGLPDGTVQTAKQLQERIVRAVDAASSGRVATGQ